MITNEKNQYNNRQLKAMRDKIQSYLNAQITLGDLINDLEALLDCMGEVDALWEKKFRVTWGRLEDVYSFSIYEKKTTFDKEDKREIDDAIQQILYLISSFEEK